MRFFLFLTLISWQFKLQAQLLPLGTGGWQRSLDGRQGFVYESHNLRINQLSKTLFKNDDLKEFKLAETQVMFRITPYTMGMRKNPEAAIKKLTLNRRKHGIFGCSVYPQINVGLTFLKEFTKVNSNYQASSVTGLVVTPGYNIALPFCVVEANLNTTYYFKNTNAFGRFHFTPSIGFKFDGLLELLDVETELGQQSIEAIDRKIVDNTSSTSRREGDYIVTTTTTNFHYELEVDNREYYYRSVSNFGGLTLRYLKGRNVAWSGNTTMFGIGYTTRFNMAGLDAILEHGTQGYSSSLVAPIYTYRPELADIDIDKQSNEFAAEGTQTRLFARYSFDALQVIMRYLNRKSSATGGDRSRGVKTTKGSQRNGAFRMMAGIGLGYAFVQKPVFLSNTAQQKKNDWFAANPEILRYAPNDATRTKSGFLYHAFLAIEFGVIGIEWSMTPLFDSPLSTTGRYSDFTVHYTIPIRKIWRDGKSINQLRKVITKEKK